MRQSVFITEAKFISPHWQAAYPECEIRQQQPHNITADTILWILAGSPDWLSVVQRYSKNRIPVIVMSKELNMAELCAALQVGARGYVEAFASKVIIEQVAETVISGGIWLPGQLLSNLVGVLSKQSISYQHACDLTLLTKREHQVVDIVVTGASNKMVAKQLNITERTVKEHMSSIFNKLKVRDRMQLMLAVKGS
ncbi:response regulator transcription factor [Pseudoalteromonas sp. SR44-5]|uniref:Response regulator transcription factor n=1 Tax=Pseudoalteromonas rhizosphaerae TaxID=2518973 RepID=A0ABW8L3D3_9GAMM|nr:MULTISPECIES: response regulator transcription factor [unclassified Pseudoalteromonas]MBB1343818.1 response regulator transcription factor [Pseudoalteromonas sp. SR45-6]MBB1368693.1 response regulator transcription factor [Pseudoalteromonas sp. SR44-5]MBB1419465.1 response regulator transcription factor [Pseudoalteromonas sp. SG44-1]MBB1424120.1 response regulator transcription factor [Pseudoalteromonas sp. SG43-7]MBB1436469.1 response regulator transcription factor [Pseudoalteromonas sp. S